MDVQSPIAIASGIQPWWRNRSVQLAALVLLVALGVLLRVANLDGVTHRTPDERAYTEAARVLLDQGIAGIPVLEARVAQNPMTAANPIRTGYLFLLAATMNLTGHSDESAGAELACASSILCVFLLAALAWRRFPPTVALVATLLYAVSPAALMTARRGWADSLVEALTLLLLFAACEIAAGSRHPAWAVVVACVGALSITVKQTAALGFAFCAVWILAVLLLRRERRTTALFAGLFAAAALAAVAWLVYLLGGWQHFAALLSNSLNSSKGNAYSIAYESGSAWLLGKAAFIVSTPTLLLTVPALFHAGQPRRPMTVERQITLALFAMCAVFLASVVLMTNRLNLRYLAPLFAPASLLAGVGMAFLLDLGQRLQPTWSAPLAGLAAAFTLAAAVLDYTHFHTQFAQPDVQDLSLRMVLEAGGSPPPPPVAAQNTLDFWLAAALEASQAGDCQKTIDAATRAAQIDANSAVAWNDLAAGFECSHQWPSAIAAARRALEIQPDFQLARNNLNWSLAQQAKQSPK